MCEKTFYSEKELLEHEAEHQTCGLDGCTFTAAPSVMNNNADRIWVQMAMLFFVSLQQLEVHILHLHASGLHSRMIHGNTPEDVAKWRAQRKK